MRQLFIEQVDNGWYITLTTPGPAAGCCNTQSHFVYTSLDALLAALPELLGKSPLALVELAPPPPPETDTVNPPAPGT